MHTNEKEKGGVICGMGGCRPLFTRAPAARHSTRTSVAVFSERRLPPSRLTFNAVAHLYPPFVLLLVLLAVAEKA